MNRVFDHRKYGSRIHSFTPFHSAVTKYQSQRSGENLSKVGSLIKNGEAWKEIQIKKKVSNEFMFAIYLIFISFSFYFIFSILESFPVCAILGQFLSQLGQFISCFHLSLFSNSVSSLALDPYPAS